MSEGHKKLKEQLDKQVFAKHHFRSQKEQIIKKLEVKPKKSKKVYHALMVSAAVILFSVLSAPYILQQKSNNLVQSNVSPPNNEIITKENKPENEPEEAVSVPSEIIAPFPLGTPLSELKEHYGKPSYDDYYNGGKLVAFDKEGYFIDELNETVRGYYFAAPTLSVFGATVGMTAEEINQVFAESVQPVENLDSDGYLLFYNNKNGFKIIFTSETKNGPTTSVSLTRE